MTLTKSYPTGSTNLFIKLYNLFSKLFNTSKKSVSLKPDYFNDEDLELKNARELARKQIEKYQNQTYLHLH